MHKRKNLTADFACFRKEWGRNCNPKKKKSIRKGLPKWNPRTKNLAKIVIMPDTYECPVCNETVSESDNSVRYYSVYIAKLGGVNGVGDWKVAHKKAENNTEELDIFLKPCFWSRWQSVCFVQEGRAASAATHVHYIYIWLKFYLPMSIIPCWYQHGFRWGLSCDTQLALFIKRYKP